jgi:hypothetical protein
MFNSIRPLAHVRFDPVPWRMFDPIRPLAGPIVSRGTSNVKPSLRLRA